MLVFSSILGEGGFSPPLSQKQHVAFHEPMKMFFSFIFIS